LLKDERRRFIEKEWPKVVERIDRLGLDAADLLGKASKAREKGENND
jgi:GntR family transcriptional regulator